MRTLTRFRFVIIVIVLLAILAAVNRGNEASTHTTPTTIRTYDNIEDCYADPSAVDCQPIP